jgi:DnaJ-class molecular chaperone
MQFEPEEFGAVDSSVALDGAVELTIPARTNSGRTFRLKGEGLTG